MRFLQYIASFKFSLKLMHPFYKDFTNRVSIDFQGNLDGIKKGAVWGNVGNNC